MQAVKGYYPHRSLQGERRTRRDRRDFMSKTKVTEQSSRKGGKRNARKDRSEYYRRYYQSRKENVRQAMQDV